MLVQVVSAHLRRRRDSYANWVANDPVLLYGEMAITYDIPDGGAVDRYKIGDGRRPFTQLPWLQDFTKLDLTAVGKPNGVAPLDANGRIPMQYLPNVKLLKYPVQSNELFYTGEQQQPIFDNYDPEDIVLTGTLKARAVGTYHVAARPLAGRLWEDGTRDTVIIEWTIKESDSVVQDTA